MPSRSAVTAAVAGMAATWAAAGSLGLVAPPFRIAMVWVGLAVACMAVWPRRSLPWNVRGALVAVACCGLVLLASNAAIFGILGVALVLAALALASDGLNRQLLTVIAMAAAVLAIFRLALTSVPIVWTLADALGETLGSLGSAIAGKPLRIGATFAGLDLLVLMAIVWLGWLRLTPSPRRRIAAFAAAAIVAAHLVYLVLLATATDIAAALPPAPPASEDPFLDFYVPPERHWTEGIARALPWNVPMLGIALYLAVAAAMLGRTDWRPAEQGDPWRSTGIATRSQAAVTFASVLLAMIIPVVVAFAPGTTDLKDCRIVALDEGYLDWEKPVFDQYGQASAGMYGMLPGYVESLGGSFARSAELADSDLRQANVLIVFHPTRMWSKQRCERIWDFVRSGGSLLLVGGSSIPDDKMGATVNQVLLPTSMKVRFDTALASVPYWKGILQAMSHPALSGLGGNNRFGLLLGPSIQVGWPARPLLIGQYGWSDPGCDAALNTVYRFDPGERLGDVLLAAEQRLGKGTVVVLADPFPLTNEGNPAAFAFTGRLLSYLANRPANPQSVWRQALALLMCSSLAGLLVWRNETARVAAVAASLTVVLLLVQTISAAAAVQPEGTPEQPLPVAYIDGSHLEAYDTAPWGFDDVAGLKLTLMRNGYLPLIAADLKPARLARAAMLISIAPAKAFTAIERRTIRDFVDSGGIFISMTGAEDAGPSRPLLHEFGFHVPPPTLLPPPDVKEPRYERHFRSRYLNAEATGGHDAYAWFNAAWPVEFSDPDIIPVVADFDNRPLIGVRTIGKGKVVVIGDTGFAMNKNLEYVGGQPFGGGYENAHFWRWFLTFLNDRPVWIPPPPPQPASKSAEASLPENEAGEEKGQEGSP